MQNVSIISIFRNLLNQQRYNAIIFRNNNVIKFENDLIVWETNKEACLLKFNDKITKSAITCGAKIQGCYI